VSASGLWCARLALTDFRNHAATSLSLDARPVCLYGPNGAGKTNLLEALTTLAPGRSLRGAAAQDLARVAGLEERARLWTVSATLIQNGDQQQVGAGLDRTPDGGVKKLARLSGRAATAAELSQAARMLWVTPAMDRLFVGSAGDRRRFFDRLVMARTPGHGAAAVAYERAQRERQRLLSDDRGADPAWLSGLEETLAVQGAQMAAARASTLVLLQGAIADAPEGAFPKAEVALDGPLEAGALGGESLETLAETARRALRDGRGVDARAGRTLFGPHRSDLIVRHGPKQMPAALCSTGEQKALLLGLILAQARALAADPSGGAALILIDEAAAHLDADRRAALYDALLALAGQAWLTGTDEGLFEAFGARAQRFEVRDGQAAVIALP
jgi:DNA replication and repair protein RecF